MELQWACDATVMYLHVSRSVWSIQQCSFFTQSNDCKLKREAVRLSDVFVYTSGYTVVLEETPPWEKHRSACCTNCTDAKFSSRAAG